MQDHDSKEPVLAGTMTSHDSGAQTVQPMLFVTEKTCLGCEQSKPITDFPRNGRAGYKARCKPCHCSDMKRRQKAARARAKVEREQLAAQCATSAAPRTSKRCARCQTDKPLEEFSRCYKGASRRHAYCRRCAHDYKMEAKARRVAGALTERQQLTAEGLKWCTGCQQARPVDAFARQGRWRCYLCRDCRRAQRRSTRTSDRRAAQAEAERLYQHGLKRCNRCQHVKRVSAFGLHRWTADGLNWWCRACNGANAMAYYAANTEARIAYVRTYRNQNKDKVIVYALNRRARLRQARGRLTADDIALLYDVQRGRCAYCLAELGTSFHRDHMTPLGPAGPNSIENIALSCSRCNWRKHTRSAGQWLAVLIKKRCAQAAV